ncbi:hypothetical protein KIPB_006509, partial [Kipferlia bialata]
DPSATNLTVSFQVRIGHSYPPVRPVTAKSNYPLSRAVTYMDTLPQMRRHREGKGANKEWAVSHNGVFQTNLTTTMGSLSSNATLLLGMARVHVDREVVGMLCSGGEGGMSLYECLFQGLSATGEGAWDAMAKTYALSLLATLPTDPTVAEALTSLQQAVSRSLQEEALRQCLSCTSPLRLKYSLESLDVPNPGSQKTILDGVLHTEHLADIVLSACMGVLQHSLPHPEGADADTSGMDVESDNASTSPSPCPSPVTDRVTHTAVQSVWAALARVANLHGIANLYDHVTIPRTYLTNVTTVDSRQWLQLYHTENNENKRYVPEQTFTFGGVDPVSLCLRALSAVPSGIASMSNMMSEAYPDHLSAVGKVLTWVLLLSDDPVSALLDSDTEALDACLSCDLSCTAVNTALLTVLSRTDQGQRRVCRHCIERIQARLLQPLSTPLRLGVTALFRVADGVLSQLDYNADESPISPMMLYAKERLEHLGPTPSNPMPRVDDTCKYTDFVTCKGHTEPGYTELILLLDVFYASDVVCPHLTTQGLLYNVMFCEGENVLNTSTSSFLAYLRLMKCYEIETDTVAQRMGEVVSLGKAALQGLSSFVAPFEYEPHDTLSLDVDIDRSLPSGLKNLGASCFANAVLQLLFSVTPFRQGVLAIDTSGLSLSMSSVDVSKAPEGSNDLDHLMGLQRLFRQMESGLFPTLSTTDFFSHLHFPGIDPTHQQDASEFMSSLLSSLSDACKGLGVTDVVKTVFGGLNGKRFVGKGSVGKGPCTHTREGEHSDYSVHYVVAKDVSTLSDGIVESLLPSEVPVRCQECGQDVPTDMYATIQTLPNMLLLSLKRFYFDMTTFTDTKVNTPLGTGFGQTLS